MFYETENSSSWGYGGAMGLSTCNEISSEMDPLQGVARVAAENAVVIVSEGGCCMCHAVKRLLCGMGVNPIVYELDGDAKGREVKMALNKVLRSSNKINNGASPVVPVVFIGGVLVGAVDRVLAAHINGTLVPLLKQAGALWL